MNSKMVIYTSVFLVVAIGLVYLIADSNSQPKVEAMANQNQIIVESDNYDFGVINMNGGLVSHKFNLKNLGDRPLVITRAYTSCMCTEAQIVTSAGIKFGPYGMPGHGGLSAGQAEIGPNDDFTVEAIFDPAAHGPSGAGLANRVIYLETNSSVSPRLELNFSANVIN